MRLKNWSIRKVRCVYILQGQILGWIKVRVVIRNIETIRIGLVVHGYGVTYICQYGYEDKYTYAETEKCISDLLEQMKNERRIRCDLRR